MYSSATSGNISTQYFSEKFDSRKIDGHIFIRVYLQVPPSVRDDNSSTLMVNIEKRTIMREVSDKKDSIKFDCCFIDHYLTHWSKNISAPDKSFYDIKVQRKVSKDDFKNMDLDTMPGFILTWNYNRRVEAVAKYSNEETTQEFVK